MVDVSPNVTLVAGPSHVFRWSQQVRDGVVDSPLAWDRFIGQGGAPMWNASLLRRSAEAAGAAGDIAVIVGDFRYGNGILLEDPVPSATMMDGFLSFAAGAMSPEKDREMLQRGLAGMHAWHDTFGARARYVLWDVFCRQVLDRLAGRNVEDGPYRHPIFNYDEIVAALPEFDIIDLAPLLRLPMHELQRLFIDASNHPSYVGYLLLNGLIFEDLGALEAYNRAVATAEAELLHLARGLSRAVGRKVLLTGRSVWLDTLSRYMGATGIQRLADAGLILAPLDRVPGQLTPAELTKDLDLTQCSLAVVSAGGADLSDHLATAFGTGASRWAEVPAYDWEKATESAIRSRRETPAFSRIDVSLSVRADALTPTLDLSQVELANAGIPTWTGITGLLQRLSGAESASSLPKSEGAAKATHIDSSAVCGGTVEHPVRLQPRSELHGGSSLGRFGFLNVGTIVYGGVEIGRYFSCGRGSEIGVAPHPLTGLSTHGFTVNRAWFSGLDGYGDAGSDAPPIPAKQVTRIGHDVWIGAQVIVMPGVTIQTGAVVAANAVVTKDVEPYEIVGGVPAKHIGYRFDEDIRQRLLASEWWNLDHDVIQQLPYRDAVQAVAGLEELSGRSLPTIEDDQAANQPASVQLGSRNGSRARASYNAAPFLSLKHTTYFSAYDQLFSRFVGKAPVIVEVGVLNGGSLYMWREFFGPDARIIGIDLNPEAVWLREDGFEIHIGDQADPQFWQDFFREVGDVDILLDDGGHTYAQQIVTASSALDHIRDGGLLVVEDTHTSYMTEFGGPSDTSFVSWAVNLAHGINHRFSAFVEDQNPERRVLSVQFYESIVAFHVDRPLATVVSQAITNDGVGRDAKDFRYHSKNAMTDDDLRAYFKH